MKTLREQTPVITELLFQYDYDFVMTGRWQCDPVKEGFVKWAEGGYYLVSEFLSSECILKCKSLIKIQINFWDKGLKRKTSFNKF